jgi:D-alanyl-D-alanine carboxypeptidase
MNKYDINPCNISIIIIELNIKVTENCIKMIGTTAGLKPKTWIKLIDLFYGSMLPSGNDAAFLLS